MGSMENKGKKIAAIVLLLLLIGGLTYYYFDKRKIGPQNLCRLEASSLHITRGTSYEASDFVDNISSFCHVSFLNDEMKNYEEEGIYKITLVASDETKKNGTVKKDVTLKILPHKLTLEEGSVLLTYVPKDLNDATSNAYMSKTSLLSIINNSLYLMDDNTSLEDLTSFVKSHYNKDITLNDLNNLHYEEKCFSYTDNVFVKEDCHHKTKFALEKINQITQEEGEIILDTFAGYYEEKNNQYFIYDYKSSETKNICSNLEEVNAYFNNNYQTFSHYEHTFKQEKDNYIWLKTERV